MAAEVATNGNGENTDVKMEEKELNGKPVEEKKDAEEIVEITPELKKKIVNQIEYYFGDYNLPRDKFLKEEIKADDGWITMETMLKFKRLSNLSNKSEVIFEALETSTSGLMEINAEDKKIRRAPTKPLPLFNDDLKAETAKKTVYCKGFVKDGSCTLDELLEFFKQYGPYETVHMRYYFSQKDKKQGFKGSILVVFPEVEKAKAFMDLGEVKYKGVVLIRKFYETYLAEKKAEMDERRAKKEARENQVKDEVSQKFEALPGGIFLHMSGLEKEISREDIKGEIAKTNDSLAFVDYSKGDLEGYLRFSKPDVNKEVMEKLEGKLKIKDCEITIRMVEGDEEKEQLEKANTARSRALSNLSHKRKFGGHRGGRGKRRKY